MRLETACHFFFINFVDMKFISHIIITVGCLLLAACGHSDTFRAEGTIADGATINIRVITHSRSGVAMNVTAALDGKFHFEQPLKETSLVELFDNDYRPLARFIVSPGDDMKLEIDRANPYASKIDGNKDSREWSQWLNANAETLKSGAPEARNAIIAEYVSANPGKRTAEMLMASEFAVRGHESLADSLYRSIDPGLREDALTADFADMVGRLAAGCAAKMPTLHFLKRGNYKGSLKAADADLTLYVFTSELNGRDTILPTVRKLARLAVGRRLAIADMGLHQDTVPWSREIRNDSATWVQGWLAGGTAAAGVADLALPEVPYYVLADSAGRQLWRGPSVEDAYSQTMSRVK